MVTHVSAKIIALVVSMFTLILLCVTILVALGRDPSVLVGVSASVLIPSLISLITLGHVTEVKRDIGVVRTQTNGHLTALAQAAGLRTAACDPPGPHGAPETEPTA